MKKTCPLCLELELINRLRQEAIDRSYRERKRVSMSQIVTEALVAYLAAQDVGNTGREAA